MKKHAFSKCSTVDCLYFVTLIVTFAIGGTAACSVLREQEFLAGIIESDVLVLYSDMCLGLAPLAASLLVWRVWMATRYRPFAPVRDGRLPMTTIIIPAYNEGRQVLDTIRSVMASNFPARKMQVICVDDGSKDDTWQWMTRAAREFPDRVQLVRQPRNMGKRHALLAGFRLARGSVFVTLDSDSEVLADTLRHLVSPLVLSAKVGAVGGNVRVLNVEDGPIPRMLDVSFTMSFDFLRRAQSVYGGVLCTPGALSAYRAAAITPRLEQWAEQRFLGRPAKIGEDRALSNIVLSRGYRVVYQKEAVVLTTIPDAYKGLSRMLLRWARSNVRECLVMAGYLYGQFRRREPGEGWLRLAGTVELIFLPLSEALKCALLLNLLFHPLVTFRAVLVGCAISAILPTLVYQTRQRGLYAYKWALAYAIFWVTGLFWISSWGLCSAGCSGWLTRTLGSRTPQLALTVKEHEAG